MQIESCSSSRCNGRGHCVQKPLLTPPLVKKYQEQQNADACAAPTSPLHAGNTLHKKNEGNIILFRVTGKGYIAREKVS